jgi:hypothetical protein
LKIIGLIYSTIRISSLVNSARLFYWLILIFADAGMADSPSRDPFGSGTETESEAEGQDRARTERRAKREAAKQVEFVDGKNLFG